ncbi:hypothetical protein OR1_02618 [Geobacter sp. OR-1]|uniref:hypothetical protein n=1 Tax=Geobacter sp. OR-1 TaxID=1266765 RepID=UPI0005422B58|nr:hypothetical protein [Geobacter sp. OR-1]GAM10329.1 hypothetical protein OR1_02618 [Geobacter sp. OR-1]
MQSGRSNEFDNYAPGMNQAELQSLLQAVRIQYRLNWEGIHGIAHWERVSIIGRSLAERTGADIRVVDAFAYLHDSRRINDRSDHGHGRRGAGLAQRLKREFLGLDDGQIDLLVKACTYHTRGIISYEATIGTCWDADRLDLARLDIELEKQYFSTAAAKDDAFIEWARKLSSQAS